MGSALIDNWNLTEVNIIEENSGVLPNESYSDLLSSLVFLLKIT